MAGATVMTVLGPVPAEALGATLVHEHVFFDLGCYFSRAEDDAGGEMAGARVAPERRWWLQAHPMNCRDNLLQDDLEVAVAEVGEFKAAGGGTLVDVTTVGISPNPAGLAEVARRTGVNVVAGTGYYLGASYPAEVGERSVEALADGMRRDLLVGFPGTARVPAPPPVQGAGPAAPAAPGVRAGLVGELGVSHPPAPAELRVLAAAARVQRELGCAVSVHPAGPADAAGAMEAIRRAVEAGLDPARTAVDHVENRFGTDLAAIREVASRGFWLEVDCFGRECYYPHVNAQLPSDAERIRLVLGLLDAGLGSRLLFSQDICFKYELVRQGGHGYAHVLRTIRPRLLRSGVDAATVERILVDNPRRFLAGS